ncbi:MAG: DnaA N-terminal domain-containing protein [Alphaproteobacteria bacterium]
MEGGFSGGNHPPKPPSCDVPALQPAWDQVLAAFNRKYGKPTYRSWLAATAVTRMTRKGDDVVVTLRCPNRFIQNWIRDHYLADMTRWWQEASAKETGVMRVELTVEG